MDEFSEDLDGPALPDWAEEVMAKERAWWRLIRGTGAIAPDQLSTEPVPPGVGEAGTERE
ncbi:hypothetical protein FK268_11185 [Tsukamurella sputi]|uniref:Uncharacterized protein n=1 Tax=Tsukamurella sputi TaxID=2591848 RepID=A0A5C5RMA7_9ACTN|nr:hypothetical protein FK268_11185 [Tsukamurella sputi]